MVSLASKERTDQANRRQDRHTQRKSHHGGAESGLVEQELLYLGFLLFFRFLH